MSTRRRSRAPSRPALLYLILLVGLLAPGCGGAGDPADKTESRRDPELEKFWENFRAASAARGAGDLERAAGFYEHALAADPDHGDTLYYLGHFRYGRGETAAAAEHFEHLAEVEPTSLRSWQQLSLVRGQSRLGWVGDVDGAEAAASRALEVVRAESLNYELMARWNAYRGENALAREHIVAALGHNPRSETARHLQEWLDRPVAAEDPAGASALALAQRHVSRAVDLTGDGSADLTVVSVDGSQPVLVARNDGRRILPSSVRFRSWENVSGVSESGPFPVPTAAAVVSGPYGELIVLVGGGSRGTRLYEAAGELYREADTSHLPGPDGPPLLAAADFDGDGIDDLVLANLRLSDDSQALGGRLYWGLADGSFRPSNNDIAGPLLQLAAADLDGDGDPDLIVGRAGQAIESEEVAGDHAPPIAAAATMDVVFLLNDGGRLAPSTLETPVLPADVRNIVVADLDDDGRTDLFFATGSWAPETVVADLLWLGTDAGFRDASERLGLARHGVTFLSWRSAEGLVLVRGGIVPADPRRTVLLEIR